MPYTGISGRGVLCNATFFAIGGQTPLALATGATLTASQEIVEVTAPRDTWKQREPCGPLDWELSCDKIIGADEIFLSLVIAGGQVVVSGDTIGSDKHQFYGVGLLPGASHKWDSPQTESINIIGAGLPLFIT